MRKNSTSTEKDPMVALWDRKTNTLVVVVILLLIIFVVRNWDKNEKNIGLIAILTLGIIVAFALKIFLLENYKRKREKESLNNKKASV